MAEKVLKNKKSASTLRILHTEAVVKLTRVRGQLQRRNALIWEVLDFASKFEMSEHKADTLAKLKKRASVNYRKNDKS